MSTQSTGAGERSGRNEERDAKRAVLYRLKYELRRVERLGRGESGYASSIRQALKVIQDGKCDEVLSMIERDLDRTEFDPNDEPYAEVLTSLLSNVDEADDTCEDLFAFYLRRMEAEGRGHEPYAEALRKALHAKKRPSVGSILFAGGDQPDDAES